MKFNRIYKEGQFPDALTRPLPTCVYSTDLEPKPRCLSSARSSTKFSTKISRSISLLQGMASFAGPAS